MRRKISNDKIEMEKIALNATRQKINNLISGNTKKEISFVSNVNFFDNNKRRRFTDINKEFRARYKSFVGTILIIQLQSTT